MDGMRRLVTEVHRRSLWQVLGIYLAVSWVVLQVVDALTESAGLPDWVPAFALVLLLIGLPVVLATAFVQEGVGSGAAQPPREADAAPSTNLSPGTGGLDLPSTRPSFLRRQLTWKRAMLGGAGAFGVLGVAAGGYFALWSSGIGPVGSLAAQGVFGEREPVVLAEFRNTTPDPTLGRIVTETLRIDLASSSALTLVEPSRVREALQRMQRDPDAPLTADVAQEIAVREGLQAVLEGEIGSAGSGFILLASIRASETGAPLATFRRTASGPDGVIEAIDKLSQDVREKAGESLRSIRAEEPLEAVTTASLDALRKYSEAVDLSEKGQGAAALRLLEEAVALDPGFAMAWRKMAVVLEHVGESRTRIMDATRRAYELRERLSELERYLAVAYYHDKVTQDLDAAIAAYESVLRSQPDDGTALNNLAIRYQMKERFQDAIALLERAIGGPGESSAAYTNLTSLLAVVGRVDDARTTLAVSREKYPGRLVWDAYMAFTVEAFAGDLEAAHGEADRLAEGADLAPSWQEFGDLLRSVADAARGRLVEARGHMEGRIRLSASHPATALTATSDLAVIELRVARRPHRALALLDGADGRRLLAEVPEAERNHRLTLGVLLGAGGTERAREALDAIERERPEELKGADHARLRRWAEAGIKAAEGDVEGAVSALRELRRSQGCQRCYAAGLGELLQASRRHEEAAEEWERVARVPELDFLHPLDSVLAHEHLCEIAGETSDAAMAAEHCKAFADAWAGADPELQPRVRAARELLARLAGGA